VDGIYFVFVRGLDDEKTFLNRILHLPFGEKMTGLDRGIPDVDQNYHPDKIHPTLGAITFGPF
jgi:hypothetical protein